MNLRILKDNPVIAILIGTAILLMSVTAIQAGYDVPPGIDMPFSIDEVIECPNEVPLGNLEPHDTVDRTIEVTNSSHNDQIVTLSTDDDERYEGLTAKISPAGKAVVPAKSSALWEVVVDVRGDAEPVDEGNLHISCERWHE